MFEGFGYTEPPSSNYKFLATDRSEEIWVAVTDGALPLSGVFVDPISITLIAERDNEKLYRLTAHFLLHEAIRTAVDALVRHPTPAVPQAVQNLKKAIADWRQN